jgi:MSHA pilin protein MshD
MSTTRTCFKFQVASCKLQEVKVALRGSNLKPETRNLKLRNSLGVSLIELIVFIVVVSVAVAGVLAALNISARASADPMVQKQALAIAEALLEEVQLQPFTYCDPDDPNAATALNSAGCTGGAGGANDETRIPLGAEAGESRTSTTTPFDNVSDYMLQPGGLPINPITDLTGTAIPGLAGYAANITVAGQALGGVSATESLLITVTVTAPGNTTVTLHGYRVRYAPNALP